MKEWYVSNVTKAGVNMTCISLHLITTSVQEKVGKTEENEKQKKNFPLMMVAYCKYRK